MNRTTAAETRAPDGAGDPERPTAPVVSVDETRRRFTTAYAIGSLAGAGVFFAILLDWGRHPLRTAVSTGFFSQFYDLQARALLDGHLDVPIGSLSIEGFRVRGQEFMYFPPWPSIVRMPVLAVTDRFDGRLTTMSMTIAFIAFMVFAGLLAWRVRELLAPDRALSTAGAVGVAVWATLLGGGSTITYLAALPWVYHEAYLWAIAGAVGTLWAVLGAWQRPSGLRVIAVAPLATITILSRTTAGWAVVFAAVTVGAVLAWRRRREGDLEGGLALAVVGLVALGIGAGLNWAKFRHPYMFPLEDQVWTALNRWRAYALDANGGDLTNPRFVPTMLQAYFRPDGIRFATAFPWITLPAEPAGAVGDVVVDQRYRTGSVLAFMPGLLVVALAGLVALVRRRERDRAGLWVVTLAALLVPGPILVYGYIAHRYTAEFIPPLVVLGAIGLVALDRPLAIGRRARRATLAAIVVLGLYGVTVNVATATAASRMSTRGDSLVELVERRVRWSGLFGADSAAVRVDGTALPDDAPVDTLVIVGDCHALYLATGDLYEPWIPVTARGVDVSITIERHADAGETRIVEFEGSRDRAIAFQHDGQGNYRLAIVGNYASEWSDWLELPVGATMDFEIEPDTGRGEYRLTAPGWVEASIPIADWDRTWISIPNLLVPQPAPDPATTGLNVRTAWRAAAPLCQRLEGTA